MITFSNKQQKQLTVHAYLKETRIHHLCEQKNARQLSTTTTAIYRVQPKTLSVRPNNAHRKLVRPRLVSPQPVNDAPVGENHTLVPVRTTGQLRCLLAPPDAVLQTRAV